MSDQDRERRDPRPDVGRPQKLRRGERLVGVFLGGIAALNFPILSIFDETLYLLGIPVLYCYLFAVWILIIVATAFVLRGRQEP